LFERASAFRGFPQHLRKNTGPLLWDRSLACFSCVTILTIFIRQDTYCQLAKRR
jgi:hypothetical protein